jgi:intracellular multiplication protein IcmP
MPTFSKVKSLLPNHLYVKQKIDDPEGQRMLFKRCVFVDDSQLTKHFTLRLGNRLTSVYEMSLPRRLLLAMCLLMAKGATKNGVNEAYALNRAINRSFKLKNTLFRTAPLDAKISDCNCDQIIKDNIDNPLFVEALKKHAYELTFLNAAIEIARGYGKFFTSHNYWIKFFDRDLWFMFDQSGSATAWTETSAVRGHYLWEKKCNFAILEPCVDTTIVGLKKFMTHTENWIYQEGYTLE